MTPSIQIFLGPELIFEILDWLAVPLPFHQRFCDPSVLAACSTVCRTWSAHAQRLLFRRVILPHNLYREPYSLAISGSTLPTFLAAIDPATERGRWLAACVVSFTFRRPGRQLTISDSAAVTALATALLRMPNLRHLDVTTISCDFNTTTLETLRESGPRIASLHILQDISLRTVHTHIMHRLVAAFPSIKLLEITTDLQTSLPPFDPPLNLALLSVKFNANMVSDIGPCLASLVRRPAADSGDGDGEAEPLQLIWHKSTGTRPSELDGVLAAHGAGLRALAVKTLDAAAAHAALARCTRLERFELGRFPDTALLALIPRTISALAISGAPDDARLDGLVDALPSFPDLKVLTWSGCPLPRMFPALEVACTRRGVELRMTSAIEVADDNAIEVELRRRYIRI
ncbi:hypothetical protein GGX14DRAFT_698918 [Mycena pura]|uniref:F-box domain-containing protein n=1 Tax=Mycena pura TaxID=153505 RepID=A0AAD6Y6D4_9AGAR|nr:hypothetical protein GGX14DRAFT_698918 [Mycena pura]